MLRFYVRIQSERFSQCPKIISPSKSDPSSGSITQDSLALHFISRKHILILAINDRCDNTESLIMISNYISRFNSIIHRSKNTKVKREWTSMKVIRLLEECYRVNWKIKKFSPLVYYIDVIVFQWTLGWLLIVSYIFKFDESKDSMKNDKDITSIISVI